MANDNQEIELDLTSGAQAASRAVSNEVANVDSTDVAIKSDQTLLHEVFAELNIAVNQSFESLINGAVSDGSRSMYLAIRSGVQFIAAKESADMSASFNQTLKELDYPHQRASEDMRIAKAYMAIPARQRKSFIAMGKVKAIKVASLEPEQITELIETDPDALDEFSTMSRQDLTAEIKRLKHANVNQAAELETTKSQLKRAQHKTHATNFEFETETVRLETMHLQGEFELALNGIEKQFNRVINDIETQEKPLRIEHVYLAAVTALARATDLVERMKAFPFDYPERPTGAHTLSAEEAAAWLQAWSTMQARSDGEALMRSNERENQKPGKRGRKTKIVGAK